MNLKRHTLIPLCALLLLAGVALRVPAAPKPPTAQGPPIVYSVLSAVAPGQSVEVTWYGESLGQPVGLWTNFRALVTPVPLSTQPGQAKYRITAAGDVPVGVYAVRLMTSAGASSARLLLVDDLPTVLRRGGNTTPDRAQVVSTGNAIDAACEPLTADYYRISGKKGQRLAVEVFAQRMGSRMDPMVRLLDSRGRELVYCDDSPGAGSDCRFAYTFQVDGDYTLEIRDVNYEGGEEYRYRLRLGDFPIVICPSPLSGKRGAQVDARVEDEGCEKANPVSLLLPSDRARTWFGVKAARGLGSALVPMLACDVDETVETGSNDTRESAMPLPIPGAVSAHFSKPKTESYFSFAANKRQTVGIRAFARAIGSSANPSLQILSTEGKELAASKVVGAEDASVQATMPADGTYLVRARELSGAAGPGMYYRLEFRPVTAGFSMTVDTEQLNATPGSSVRIKVTATRRDFTGPITLSPSGDAAQFALSENVIVEGKSETELQIMIPADAPADRPLNFGIVGSASVKDVLVIERASTLPALQKLFPRMRALPIELDGIIGLGVRKQSP